MGANAQTSVPAFTAGQVLTAAQVTQINTGIPVFATSTERDAAFGGTGEKTLAEGQMAFLEDINVTQVYDGSAWVDLGGKRTTFTPASYVGLTVGNGTETAAYVVNGDVMTVDYQLVFGSTTAITGTNPVIALPTGYSRATNVDIPCGMSQLRDTGTAQYLGVIMTNGSGLLVAGIDTAASYAGFRSVTSTLPFTWTTTDEIRFTATLQVNTP